MSRCMPLSFIICLIAPAASAAPLASGGIWTAFGDTDAAVKTCSVQGAVGDGILKLSVASDHQNMLHLQLSKVAWEIPNRVVPITLVFPDGTVFSFTGSGQGSAMDFDVPLSDMKSFIHEFTAQSSAALSFPQGREWPWTLPLAGSTSTITAMGKCMETAGIVLQPLATASLQVVESDTSPKAMAAGDAPDFTAPNSATPNSETPAPAVVPASPDITTHETTYSQNFSTNQMRTAAKKYTRVLGAIGLGLAAIIVASIAMYFIPTIIGSSRRIQNVGLLFLVNLVFGWTLIGWFACLLWAALAQDGTQRLLYQRMLLRQNDY